MDEPYTAQGVNIYFDAGTSNVFIAEAKSEQWARHLATALNHWDKS